MRPIVLLCLLFVTTSLFAQDVENDAEKTEEIFSGPQVGEKLVDFEVQGVLGDLAGKKFNPVKDAGEKPLLLIFVHEVTRPSIGLTRTLGDYATKLGSDKLSAAVVFLTDDATETENFLKRAMHAMPKVPLGISPDGQEGPGAYGLNRKVSLTILVGKEGKTLANFALVQPSLAVDAPKIAKALHAALGEDKTPTLAELGAGREMAAPNAAPDLRPILAPVIRKTATPEEVDAAAKAAEAAAAKDPAVRKAIGDVTRRIITAGVLENYGTAEAQVWLKKWSEEFK
jgi:hypothetical protein